METERLRVKRLFVWKFTLTSFGFGLFIGLLFSIALVLASFLGLGQIDVFGKQVDLLRPSFIVAFSALATLVLSLAFAFIGFLYSLFYNLLSKIGFNIDLGLSEVEQVVKNEPVQAQQMPMIQQSQEQANIQPGNQFY